MRKYPKYKPSGMDWLGDIPGDWNCKILKRITKFAYGDSLSDENRNGGKVPVYGSNGIVGFHDNAITKAPCIIVGRKGSYGRINYSEKACFPIDTSYFIDSTQTKCDLKWLMYFLSILRLDENTLDDTVPGLSREWAYRMPSLILSSPEQKSIVRFLDYKTGQIDSFIANRQTQIELLKEQKAGIINKAVTKGINPNAKMKPSGIEWIGEIPETWKVIKLKFCLKSMVGGGTPSKEKPEYWNGDIPWVSPKDMKTDFIEKSEDYITLKGLKESSTILIKEPSILIVVRSGILKHTLPISVNTVQVTLNQDLKALIPNKKFSIEYLSELFRGVSNIILFNCTKVVATVDSIETDDLLKFLLPVPTIKEQKEILDYIKSDTLTIDTLISKYQKQIDLMQEYRISLISQAVTGKIDVRDWQPKKKVET